MDSIEAFTTSSALYTSDVGYWSDRRSRSSYSGQTDCCSSYNSSSSPGHHIHHPPTSPSNLSKSLSSGTISQLQTWTTPSSSSAAAAPSYCGISSGNSSAARHNHKSMIMNDADKAIYNSLGSSSSPRGKLTYYELGLMRGWKKRGTMWKTGPNPTWLSSWNKRFFVLKGNFLYYFAHRRDMKDAPVLGAIYLRNAIIKKESMTFAKWILKISPPVPRRMGCSSDTSDFFIKFKSESERSEWYEDLQQVSFENDFPAKKEPLITSSMQFVTSYTSTTTTGKYS